MENVNNGFEAKRAEMEEEMKANQVANLEARIAKLNK